MFEMYDSDGEYIRGTRTFGTATREQLVNPETNQVQGATIHKTELGFVAKAQFWFRSGMHVIHSQPDSKYPSQNYKTASGELVRADAYLAAANPDQNFYIMYGKNVVRYSADAPTLRNATEWSKPAKLHVTNMNW